MPLKLQLSPLHIDVRVVEKLGWPTLIFISVVPLVVTGEHSVEAVILQERISLFANEFVEKVLLFVPTTVSLIFHS